MRASVCSLPTLNAEHLPQFQCSSSDFAQGPDDALGVGLGQEGAGVQNAPLIFTWKSRKNRKGVDFTVFFFTVYQELLHGQVHRQIPCLSSEVIW